MLRRSLWCAGLMGLSGNLACASAEGESNATPADSQANGGAAIPSASAAGTDPASTTVPSGSSVQPGGTGAADPASAGGATSPGQGQTSSSTETDPAAGGQDTADGAGETGTPPAAGSDAPGTDTTPPQDAPSEDPTQVEPENPPADPADPADPTQDPAEPELAITRVVFEPASGTFEPPLAVTLSAPEAGEIRYTTDGTLPSAESPLYSAALELGQTTQVRAQLFVGGVAQGVVASGLFVARDFDATSDIPLLIIDGYAGGKPRDKELFHDAAFMLFEPAEGSTALSAPPSVVSRAGYRLRGQSSQSFAKTPYRVELWGEQDEDEDRELGGLPAEADWALIGPYIDRSLIRHPFVYELGREMGLQAPRSLFVEAYINNDAGVLSSAHYEGVYLLVETIKNASNRLNLKQLKEDDTAEADITGGYIFSFEYRSVEGPSLTCSGSDVFHRGITGGLGIGMDPITDGFCWTDLEVRDPAEPNQPQLDYLSNYIHEFHGTLHQSPLGDYASYIDVASFVDHFIVSEFTRNLDAYVKSAFYHKDRDGLLVAGPLWDYNLSLNAGGFFENTEIAGWQLGYRRHTVDWFFALAEDPGFMALVSARWKELRQGPFSDAALIERLDAMAAPLAQAAARDFQRWPTSSIDTSLFSFPAGTSWEQQLQAIRDWMPQRAAWLDGAVDQPVDIPEYP